MEQRVLPTMMVSSSLMFSSPVVILMYHRYVIEALSASNIFIFIFYLLLYIIGLNTVELVYARMFTTTLVAFDSILICTIVGKYA